MHLQLASALVDRFPSHREQIAPSFRLSEDEIAEIARALPESVDLFELA